MALEQTKTSQNSSGLSCALKSSEDEVITVEECKQYIGKYELSDERISTIKNNLIGIVDTVLNTYLEEFK